MSKLDNFMYHGNFVEKVNEMSKSKPLEIYLPFLTLAVIKGNFEVSVMIGQSVCL